MTFIKRLSNSIPITASPNAQEEIKSQAQAPTNFGIASTPDIIETNVSNNLGLFQPQPQSLSVVQPSVSEDMVVEASFIFDYQARSAENRILQDPAKSEELLNDKEQLSHQLTKLSERKGGGSSAVQISPDIQSLIKDE